MLNPLYNGTESPKLINIHIPDLKALEENDESLREHVDYQIYISFSFNPVDNYEYHRKNLYGLLEGIST